MASNEVQKIIWNERSLLNTLISDIEIITNEVVTRNNEQLKVSLLTDHLCAVVGDYDIVSPLLKKLIQRIKGRYDPRFVRINLVGDEGYLNDLSSDDVQTIMNKIPVSDKSIIPDNLTKCFTDFKEREADTKIAKRNELLFFAPQYLFVFVVSADYLKLLENSAVFSNYLFGTKNYGVGSIVAVEHKDEVPENCNTVIEMDGPLTGVLSRKDPQLEAHFNL